MRLLRLFAPTYALGLLLQLAAALVVVALVLAL